MNFQLPRQIVFVLLRNIYASACMHGPRIYIFQKGVGGGVGKTAVSGKVEGLRCAVVNFKFSRHPFHYLTSAHGYFQDVWATILKNTICRSLCVFLLVSCTSGDALKLVCFADGTGKENKLHFSIHQQFSNLANYCNRNRNF